MKRVYMFLGICVILIIGFISSTKAQTVYYVANGGAWTNWDLYSYDIGSSVETRLTTDPAIDNHPVISHFDTTRIAFSSTRDGGEFDIYVADVDDIDNTAVRLTFNDDYPDRHPHWHPDGNLIIYTSKDRPVTVTETLATECSQPIITHVTRYYEGMNIIDLNPPIVVIPLDVATAWDSINDPDIWVHGDAIYVGHPSFNHQGDLLVFTAAIDGEGKNWEVYTAGFNPVSISLIPNSLVRITHGPNVGSNPIKMSGGATFNHDDTEIIFNSTRTTGGNSQIFSLPVSSVNVTLNSTYRRTFHRGNDYVPEALENGDIVFSSDLGKPTICPCDTFPGSTDDLDVVLLENWSTRTILGTDSFQETLLLSDEVSWFCGLKPNLTQCTFQPRIMSVESLWLEFHPADLLPPDLLAGYGQAYANNAIEMYDLGWQNLANYLYGIDSVLMNQIYQDMGMLWNGWPGWNDPNLLQNWLDATAQLRMKKYVVPVIMYETGLGESCVFHGIVGIDDDVYNELSVRSFNLHQNYPNPFNPNTLIKYQIPELRFVTLKVYDVLGNEVATLVNEEKSAGSYEVEFSAIGGSASGGDAYNLSSGIYFYKLQAGNFVETKKMILLK
ncbi:MAG: hypothetical protein DRQ01_01065 [Ignavibacteriae bacterium]|nr:MAG: hypothetical protein DRQ01_01065 [Ignavibacteriota bacterium]